ncbi:MAG TPA: hypothetical protein VIG99_25690 [Myxococcaceae bacterium]
MKKAKKRAALRETVSKPLRRRSAFKMITFGGPKPIHHDPEDFKRILQEEDIRSLRART